MNPATETLLRIAEGFLLPYDILLSQLTGRQLGMMKEIYSVLPTPLERIEIILSRIEHTIANMFANTVSEFHGSIIPKRSDLWDEKDDVQTEDDETLIMANLHMHMAVNNALRGA